MNLQRLTSSEASYQKLKQKTLEIIKNDQQKQNVLRNIVLFCKAAFSNNSNMRKKYLCLLLIRDLFQAIGMEYFQKLVDQYLAQKIFQMVQTYLEFSTKGIKLTNDEKQNSDRLFVFAVQTIVFWAKRLSLMQKSVFCQVYEELKKLKIDLPQQFQYYKREMLLQLFKSESNHDLSKQYGNPIVVELDIKFKRCKEDLEQCINQSMLNDEEINTKPIIESLRDYLLFFFSNYRELEPEESQQRDIVIIYFHILNNLYKRVCNQLRMTVQELVSVTKEIFEAVYPSQYDSVDRMDIIQLAGVFKYNALNIFQRIHQRIEKQDALLGPFKFNINLQQNQRPSMPSGADGSLSLSKATSNHRFVRNNN